MLDSSACIHVLRGRAPFDALPACKDTAVSSLVAAELWTGVEKANRPDKAGSLETFAAHNRSGFAAISVAGDADRLDHANYLRLKVTGIDPQLYLPALELSSDAEPTLRLGLRVSFNAPPD